MIHIDGTWEPGKYLYIKTPDNRRWIRFKGRTPSGKYTPGNVECSLLAVTSATSLPPATITVYDFHTIYTIESHGSYGWRFSWITRDEAQALLDMAIAQNSMRVT